MDFINQFPSEIFKEIIDNLVITLGLKNAVKLCTVNKTWNEEIRRAIYITGVLDPISSQFKPKGLWDRESYIDELPSKVFLDILAQKVRNSTAKKRDFLVEIITQTLDWVQHNISDMFPDNNDNITALCESTMISMGMDYVHELIDTPVDENLLPHLINMLHRNNDQLRCHALCLAAYHNDTAKFNIIRKGLQELESRPFACPLEVAAAKGSANAVGLIIEQMSDANEYDYRHPMSILNPKWNSHIGPYSRSRQGRVKSDRFQACNRYEVVFLLAVINGHDNVVHYMIDRDTTEGYSMHFNGEFLWVEEVLHRKDPKLYNHVLDYHGDREEILGNIFAFTYECYPHDDGVVDFCIDLGMNPNWHIMGSTGSALYMALTEQSYRHGGWYRRGDACKIDLIHKLLKLGGDLGPSRGPLDGGCLTALGEAVGSGRIDLVQLILDQGYSINQRIRYVVLPEDHEDYDECEWNPNETDGDTPLVVAAEHGDIPMAEYLLEHGASFEVPCDGNRLTGTNCLITTAENDHNDMFYWLLEEKGIHIDDNSVAEVTTYLQEKLDKQSIETATGRALVQVLLDGLGKGNMISHDTGNGDNEEMMED